MEDKSFVQAFDSHMYFACKSRLLISSDEAFLISRSGLCDLILCMARC
jgi:hypothetical protein